MQIKMKQALEWLAKLPETLGQPGMWTRFQFREMTDAHIANTIALLDELYGRLINAANAVDLKLAALLRHQERRKARAAEEPLTVDQINEAVRQATDGQITDPNGRKARACGLEGGIAGYYQQSRGHGKATTCKCGGKCSEVNAREVTLGDLAIAARDAQAELEVTLRSNDEHEFVSKCLADRPAIEYRWREQQRADVALEIQRHYARALGGMR